ncbi:MAG: hypothetical protein ABIG65_00425, partial [Patescibacteria group bacterium]
MKKKLFFVFTIGLLALVALNIKNAQAAVTDCPFRAQANRILVDFGGADLGVGATATEADAKKGPFNVSLPAGNYQVTLVSYDDHVSHPGQDQPEERYYITLNNSSGNVVATSNSVKDIPDEPINSTWEIVNTTLSVGQAVSSVYAFHMNYASVPTSNWNSMQAICASFDPPGTPMIPSTDCDIADGCFCVTKQKLMSVKYFNKTLYAGGYGYAGGQDHEAELYTCVEGASSLEKTFDAESVFALEDFNDSLYMTHEQGDWDGTNGFATVYKLENNSWVRKFIDTNRSLGFELKKILNALYFSAAYPSGAVHQTTDGGDWNATFTVSPGCSTEYLGSHNYMLYAGSECGGSPALWRGNSERVSTGYEGEAGTQFSGMTSFGNNMYLGMSLNNCRIVKYDGDSSYQEVYQCPSSQKIPWMGATEKYVYALVSKAWDAQSGDSMIIRSSTGNSGSWSTLKTFDMPEVVWADIASDGNIYIAGGQHG